MKLIILFWLQIFYLYLQFLKIISLSWLYWNQIHKYYFQTLFFSSTSISEKNPTILKVHLRHVYEDTYISFGPAPFACSSRHPLSCSFFYATGNFFSVLLYHLFHLSFISECSSAPDSVWYYLPSLLVRRMSWNICLYILSPNLSYMTDLGLKENIPFLLSCTLGFRISAYREHQY